MKIVDAVIEVLNETKNNAIGWGDKGLLLAVYEKIKTTHFINKPRWIYCDFNNWEQKILNAIDKSQLFEKRYFKIYHGRPARRYYLKNK